MSHNPDPAPAAPDAGGVSSFRRGNIAHLTLDRAHALNALTSTMVERLHSSLSAVRDDPEVDVLLLSGQGRAFCAGSDVKEMATRPLRHGLVGDDLARARANERDRLQRAFDVVIRLHELEQPSVAALRGPVAGGGMGLALACDFRIASQGARLIPAYRRLGLPGDWGVSWFLTELAGRQYARRMLVGGSTLTAEEALAVGLVDEVVAEDELEAVVAARTDELAAGSSPATRAAKRLLRSSGLRDQIQHEIEATLRCQETAGYREGLLAFAEHREPSFSTRSPSP